MCRTYVGSNGKEIGVLRRQLQWRRYRYDKSITEANTRGQWRWTSTGEVRAMQQMCHNRSDKGEEKQLGDGTCWWSTQAGQKGYTGRAALKKNIKNGLGRLILYYSPPLKSTKTKCRQHCLWPLDEVFVLRLGAVVMMAPEQDGGCGKIRLLDRTPR